MKKIKYVVLVLFIGLIVWIAGGRISSSKEKATAQSLWSASKNSDKLPVDSDKDGLSDEEEKRLGTDPNKADTDGDGFLDGQEVKDGYSPLIPAPRDKMSALTEHYSNSNGNSNDNGNNNNNSNTNSNVNSAQDNSNSSISVNNENQNNDLRNKENLTDKVALKVDEIIASYKLFAVSYESVPQDVQDKVKQEVEDFTKDLLKGTGLDFSFNIEENKLLLDEKQNKEVKKYLEQVKNVFRKNALINDNETVENGLKKIIVSLSEMRKKDIDWEKTGIWKKEMDSSFAELSVMPVHPDLKNIHLKILHITKSFQIVFDNIQEGDYFRSFLSAGRADKINKEIDDFSEEIKKYQ